MSSPQGQVLSTDILESIIEYLGAESRNQPTTSEAFQALLNFSLTSSATLHRCRTFIFESLSFADPERKKNRPSVDVYIQQSLEMLRESPHLAVYIRKISVCDMSMVPVSSLGSDVEDPRERAARFKLLEKRRTDSFLHLLPQILHLLPSIVAVHYGLLAGYIVSRFTYT